MKIKLANGMKFKSIDGQHGEFEVKKIDFYGDDEPIWCAVDDNFIYPLSEIILSSYIPMVDGKWINEPNEYEE